MDELEYLKERYGFVEIEEGDNIIYDIKSIPSGLDGETLIRIYQNTKLLFYDSEKGDKPLFIKKVDLTDSENER